MYTSGEGQLGDGSDVRGPAGRRSLFAVVWKAAVLAVFCRRATRSAGRAPEMTGRAMDAMMLVPEAAGRCVRKIGGVATRRERIRVDVGVIRGLGMGLVVGKKLRRGDGGWFLGIQNA